MRIVVGSDDAGYSYKEALKAELQQLPGIDEIVDVGVDADDHTAYPHVGVAAARMVADGLVDRGLLVCGTGMGMTIAANKVKGVRASTAHDCYSVERLVLSNNAQVLCLGARVIGLELARKLVREWVGLQFDSASPSAAKVALIESYEC